MRQRGYVVCAGCCAALVAGCISLTADAQTIERVSVNSDGDQSTDGEASVGRGAISADGRFVAFSSGAGTLVEDDGNFDLDVFVHDRQTGETTRVSVASEGTEGNNDSGSTGPGLEGVGISADGRYVVFGSDATNLVADDDNNRTDIFVHDRQTGETTRVSVSSSGQEGNGHSTTATISADGRFLAFVSQADNLVPNDNNDRNDAFVHDIQTGQTTRASLSSAGVEGDNHTGQAGMSLSADGRFVAFASDATNLVEGDTNNDRDCFVHDRQTGETTRVSVSSEGEGGNNVSFRPDLSAYGRYVVFESSASNFADEAPFGADVYLHDRQTGDTTQIALNANGEIGDNHSECPMISGDGRFVVFVSLAGNLVPDDTNGFHDAFIRDLENETTTRISLSEEGEEVDSDIFWYNIAISQDGSAVAFDTLASNLVENDTNFLTDVFVFDAGPGDSDPADLTGLEIVEGSLISGGLPELLQSDDDYLVVRSEPGFTAFEPNITDAVIGAETSSQQASTVDVTVEQKINNPSGTAKIRLKNWNTGTFVEVATYEIGLSETTQMFNGNDAALYVRNDGRIELSLRTVVVAILTAQGFDVSTDFVELPVQ